LKKFEHTFVVLKKFIFILLFSTCVSVSPSKLDAQCSICSKTTQQLGEKPAKAFNTGIIYLMLAPFAIVGVVGYQWWKNNRQS